MAGRIVVFGATGYTGEQTTRALVRRGARPVLAARSRDRLQQLADELGGLETLVADVAQPEAVRALVGPGDLLLSTVGPFSRYGEPAVTAAIDAAATYIDSTGEPAFIRRVFEHHGPRAQQAGAVLLTAFGYDWVPGNLAGALALREAGADAARVEIGYFSDAGISGGTRASMLHAALEPSFAYRRGRLRTEPAGLRVKTFAVPGRGRRHAISVGGTEHFGLPAIHPSLRDVDVLVGQSGPHVRAMPIIARTLSAVFAVPGIRHRVLTLAEKRVRGSTGGPDDEARRNSTSTVLAVAYGDDGRQLSDVTLAGANAYTFTFEILAWAATQLADGALLGRGALSPVQAFALETLQDGATQAGLNRTT